MLSRRARLLAILLATAVTGFVSAAEWIDAPLSPETWWGQGDQAVGVYPPGAEPAWKTETYEIPLAAGKALEHMLRMNEGDMIVYTWATEMSEPAQLTAEFHGHTDVVENQPGTVMFYTKHTNGKESGSLRAPFTGVHGWYLNNASDQDIVVQLQVAGYFTYEP
jgi:hypothetical protein